MERFDLEYLCLAPKKRGKGYCGQAFKFKAEGDNADG